MILASVVLSQYSHVRKRRKAEVDVWQTTVNCCPVSWLKAVWLLNLNLRRSTVGIVLMLLLPSTGDAAADVECNVAVADVLTLINVDISTRCNTTSARFCPVVLPLSA